MTLRASTTLLVRRARFAVTAMVGLSALCGCYSFSTLRRARTVARGHYEVVAAPEAFVVASGGGASVRPVAEIGLRYGMTDFAELEGRLTTLGFTAGPRFQLLRSPDPTRGFDILAAPALAYTYPDKVAFEYPVLFGYNLGPHQLVLAPRLVYQARFAVGGQDTPVSFVYAGASFGAALRVREGFTLMPEIATLGEIYAEPGFSSNLARAAGIQASLGFLFDL